jgi:hypothetical protein
VFGSVLHAVLFLLPAVLLAIPLLARRYPGERVLLALRRAERPHWERPRSSAPSRRRVVLIPVRGGRLIGRSLAVRPPPALSPAS